MSLEGQQIDRYRILRLLGSGGMGEVYLAEDARIEQQVAIKVIKAEVSPYPDAQATQEAARLFQREARAIVKLDHPHILPLYDYGEERIGNLTVIYLVMPYRREGSLADWLRGRAQPGLLWPQEVAPLVSQAASALQHAHDHQIIHQDVKPSNFLLRQRSQTLTRSDLPDLFLADFGIARLSTATSGASQAIRGTPTSMAPEQWEGHPTPATDQYALAVMAYELLTGRPPFQGAPGPLMYQHLLVPPSPPSTFHPRLSRDIDTVLLHALAKKPEARFASVTAFSQAFQQAVQAMPAAQAPRLPSAAPTIAAPSDIRATLAISPAEARTGTTRTLTLPGGRKVTVPVPAGAQDGQVVRLEGQGEASPTGGEAGALILTLLVVAVEAPSSLSTGSAPMTEETLLTADPPEPSIPARTEVSPSQVARPASQGSLPPTQLTLPASLPPPARPGTSSLPVASSGTAATRSSGSKKTALLVIGLLLLLVLTSGLGIFYLTHPPRGTGTTGMSSSSGATAAANATATAHSQATATAAVVASNANPYSPHTGVLALTDPLSDTSRGYGWQESAQCSFSGGAYHVVEPQVAYFAWCTAQPVFSNLVYEVHMTVLQGDCGALTFRVSSAGYYFFSICQDGYYSFDVNNFRNGRGIHDLRTGHSSAIHLGLNQMNVFAVVANGTHFDMYVNGQPIDSTTDSTFSQGQIALAANTLHASTEIAYQNARVWTL